MKYHYTETGVIERDIQARLKAAQIRLHFDKVVLRLVGGLQRALADVIPDEEAVIFAITAPIKVPAKTAAVLEESVRDGLPQGERREVLHGNQVQIRRLSGVQPKVPRVLGFVHNPESDADLILTLAETRLLRA